MFSKKGFLRFCAAMKVDAKEEGVIPMSNLMGSQTVLLDRIAAGLERDVHHFVVLKGRQLGITTLCLAIDLYRHFTTRGLTGTLVTQDEASRDDFRTKLTLFYESLPPPMKVPVVQSNRNQMVFRNKSRMVYQVASARGAERLGRGRGIVMCHGTEVATWPGSDGIESLQSSFAERNPNRLFLFETTAKGFNHFYDMWQSAKQASTQEAVFLGWWMNAYYRATTDSAIFKTYWDGRLTAEERDWTRAAKKLYGVEINAGQLAWWRYYVAEKCNGNEATAYEEMPPTEMHAFQATGASFFPSDAVTRMQRAARHRHPQHFQVRFGQTFLDTTVVPCGKASANLLVWEDPNEHGTYAAGADPSYGANADSDRSVVSVWRTHADGMRQIAEFCAGGLQTDRFAWVIAYLCGAYGHVCLNLELNGPGQSVLQNLNTLRRMPAGGLPANARPGLMQVVQSMKYYVFRRLDSPTGGSGVYHWVTTARTKERMLNPLRDGCVSGAVEPASVELVNEMGVVTRDGGWIGAAGRKHDDRVIAAGLACAAWLDRQRRRLTSRMADPRGHATAAVGGLFARLGMDK